MGILSIFGVKSRNEKVKEALDRGAIIVDVRTPQEYKQGHVRSAMNVPLPNIESRVGTFQKKGKPVILCCRSGTRAGKAKKVLEKHGIEAINGGSWGNINYLIH